MSSSVVSEETTKPDWRKLLVVEQAQISHAIEEYLRYVAEPQDGPRQALDDATEKLLRFIGRCLERKAGFLEDLRWHSGLRSELYAVLTQAHERQARALETAWHLYATLPYSSDELVLRIGDVLAPLVH